ncbi:hypothetical protein RIF29_24570 [Crotalaria pallida]|uniref:Uncharacterized protein n=1 Tax=Crotalaria pallida TaxID=3830 RepID=A0AAN9EJY5_CROPI
MPYWSSVDQLDEDLRNVGPAARANGVNTRGGLREKNKTTLLDNGPNRNFVDLGSHSHSIRPPDHKEDIGDHSIPRSGFSDIPFMDITGSYASWNPTFYSFSPLLPDAIADLDKPFGADEIKQALIIPGHGTDLVCFDSPPPDLSQLLILDSMRVECDGDTSFHWQSLVERVKQQAYTNVKDNLKLLETTPHTLAGAQHMHGAGDQARQHFGSQIHQQGKVNIGQPERLPNVYEQTTSAPHIDEADTSDQLPKLGEMPTIDWEQIEMFCFTPTPSGDGAGRT